MGAVGTPRERTRAALPAPAAGRTSTGLGLGGRTLRRKGAQRARERPDQLVPLRQERLVGRDRFERVPRAAALSGERFEQAAKRYEDWYETRAGRRASRAERQLLGALLAPFAAARSALEVGCGTGHFTGWLAQRGLRVIGLDRSLGMLAEMRRRRPACAAVQADAHALPLPDRSVDLVVFVTSLEFLGDPRAALGEAVRVARQGVIAVALNRFSAGALSRRVGPASRGALRSAACDLSPRQLRGWTAEAASVRLVGLRWRSALLPFPLPPGPTRIPLGDVVGIAVALAE